MNTKIIFLSLIYYFLCYANLFPQTDNQTTAGSKIDLRGSMGLNFVSMTNLRDYLNRNYASPQDQLGTFSSAIEFAFEGGYLVKQNFQLGLEFAYETNSFNYNFLLGNYNFEYSVLMPSLLTYYVINGEGYKFKFGGGIGPRFINANEVLPTSTSKDNYSNTGLGFLVKVDGSTLLSDKMYAYISIDIRYNLNGKPQKDGKELLINSSDGYEGLELNSFSSGLKLGIAIFL
ncbi:MAG: hypothetical protein STSR0008_06080 [Ignavibacterium sp.]